MACEPLDEARYPHPRQGREPYFYLLENETACEGEGRSGDCATYGCDAFGCGEAVGGVHLACRMMDAAATAAARSDRAAADAVDAAQCQKLMGHLIIATVGEARTIVTTAMNGREALAALIDFVDGDASTPSGSDAVIVDTIRVSWNAFPNGLELSQFA